MKSSFVALILIMFDEKNHTWIILVGSRWAGIYLDSAPLFAVVSGAAESGRPFSVGSKGKGYMYIQLDWTSNTSRQKNNLPANQKRRIQICFDYFFVKLIFDLFFQNNFLNIVRRKIVKTDLDSPRRIL